MGGNGSTYDSGAEKHSRTATAVERCGRMRVQQPGCPSRAPQPPTNRPTAVRDVGFPYLVTKLSKLCCDLSSPHNGFSFQNR